MSCAHSYTYYLPVNHAQTKFSVNTRDPTLRWVTDVLFYSLERTFHSRKRPATLGSVRIGLTPVTWYDENDARDIETQERDKEMHRKTEAKKKITIR